MAGRQMDPSDISYLRKIMNVFCDIRKSSVIIADSIRVRERCALRGVGLLTDVNVGDGTAVDIADPVRCAICLGEFNDPTVVSKRCGHGMHKSCSEQQIRSTKATEQTLTCPICRVPYIEDDILLLKGILPPPGSSISWRSIFLTEPWRADDQRENIETVTGRESLDGCLERLLVSIRALFTSQNDFSRAISAVLNSFHTVRRIEKADTERLKAERDALCEREQSIRERELRDNYRAIHNEQVFVSCAEGVRNQEASLLRAKEGIILQQRQLQRMLSELKFREEFLQDRLRRFEKEQKEQNERIKASHEQIDAERAKLLLEPRSNEPTLSQTRAKVGENPTGNLSGNKRRRLQFQDDSVEACEDAFHSNDIHIVQSSSDSSGYQPPVAGGSRLKRGNTLNRRIA